MWRKLQRLKPAVDYFSLLDQPRRPWLEPEALQARFLALSAEAHPDRMHESPEAQRREAHRRYTDLNAAYHCLREPKDRLRHLLELETGSKLEEVQAAPAEAMDLFLKVGALCRETDAFLDQLGKAVSPVVRAQAFEKSIEWTDQLTALLRTIDGQCDRLHDDLKRMNADWESAPPPGAFGRRERLPLERLEPVCRALSYLTRWREQIRERVTRLSLAGVI